MPKTSSAINPLGVVIYFDEDAHTYTSNVDKQDINYVSVTSLIGKYFKPFESEKIAKIVAKKRHCTPESLLNEWADISNSACNYGTKMHEVAEDVLRGNPLRHTADNPNEQRIIDSIVEKANHLKSKFEVIGIEKIVFDHRLKIAGTIDLLLKYDDTYVILDWKTNKRISDDNRYGLYGLSPLHNIADTNLQHYTLQLSLYEYLLKHANYIPESAPVKRVLMHITPTGINKIMLEDRQSVIKDLIIDHLLNSELKINSD